MLAQLYTQRQQVKQVIYEITGIADIMRGSTAASETLGAQQIKNQWGTLRLKRAQRRVENFVRDCLQIMLEIAVTQFSPETVKVLTGTELPLESELQQAAAQGMQPPPGVLSLDRVLQVLQDDRLRSFHVSVETNSTIEEEVAQDKQDLSEMLNALGQFLNGVLPLVQSGTLPMEVAKGIMIGIVRRFRFDAELLEQLQNLPEGQGQSPEGGGGGSDGEAAAAQAQAQLDLQARQQDMQAAQTKAQLELQLRQAELQAKQQESAMRLQMLQQEHALRSQELQQKAQLSTLLFRQKLAMLQAEAAVPPAPIPASQPKGKR